MVLQLPKFWGSLQSFLYKCFELNFGILFIHILNTVEVAGTKTVFKISKFQFVENKKKPLNFRGFFLFTI